MSEKIHSNSIKLAIENILLGVSLVETLRTLLEGKKIKSKGWDGMYVLVDAETKYRVEVNQKIKTRGGSTVTLEGGSAPHTPASSGKVWLKNKDIGMGGMIYPQNVNLKWLKIK